MNAHNGFLEMMLGLGIVGLVISSSEFCAFLLGLSRCPRRRDSRSILAIVFLDFLHLLGLHGLHTFLRQLRLLAPIPANAFWLVNKTAMAKAEACDDLHDSAPMGELLQT